MKIKNVMWEIYYTNGFSILLIFLLWKNFLTFSCIYSLSNNIILIETNDFMDFSLIFPKPRADDIRKWKKYKIFQFYQLTLWQSSGGVAGGDKSNPESIFLNISAVWCLTDNPFIWFYSQIIFLETILLITLQYVIVFLFLAPHNLINFLTQKIHFEFIFTQIIFIWFFSSYNRLLERFKI